MVLEERQLICRPEWLPSSLVNPPDDAIILSRPSTKTTPAALRSMIVTHCKKTGYIVATDTRIVIFFVRLEFDVLSIRIKHVLMLRF